MLFKQNSELVLSSEFKPFDSVAKDGKQYGSFMVRNDTMELLPNGFTKTSSRVAFITCTPEGWKDWKELFSQTGNKIEGNISYFECLMSEAPVAMIRQHIFRDFDPKLHNTATPEGKAHDEAYERALCCNNSGYKKSRSLSNEMWDNGWGSSTCPFHTSTGEPILHFRMVNAGRIGTDTTIPSDYNESHKELIASIDAYIAEKKAEASLPPADKKEKKEKKETA